MSISVPLANSHYSDSSTLIIVYRLRSTNGPRAKWTENQPAQQQKGKTVHGTHHHKLRLWTSTRHCVASQKAALFFLQSLH
jgi:hypothetical protein